jgi:hypothetical protein
LRYLDGIGAIPDYGAANALTVGKAIHAGLEKGVEAAVGEYLMSFPVIGDEHIEESMKLERLIPLAKGMLPDGGEFEVEITNSDFTGFIDFLATENGVDYDMYDFKHSNNTSKYRESGQLHVYKYFFELLNPGKRISRMFFLMIPKTGIKRGKKEEIGRFRERIQAELDKIEPFLVPIEYDFQKVMGFMLSVKHALEAQTHEKRQTYLCSWCEYQDYCEKGETYMLLPKNERRNIEKVTKRTLWLYGSPFSGKTTFANKFEDPLMLNTDGNIKFVDAPFISIKNEVKAEGRMTKTTLAWEVFKGAVDELERKEGGFKTIIVDLLEDLHEHCRVYMYQKMGITHESDDGFKAWDKVRVEFLSTLRRLMNLDYENIILISHEDASKDITRKGGDKITAIKPNLQEKTSNKVSGMVDIVARVVADGDARTLSFKSDAVVFGGGRLTVGQREIPLDYAEFLKVYDEANKNAASSMRASESANGSAAKAEPEAEVAEQGTTERARRARKATGAHEHDGAHGAEEAPSNVSEEAPSIVSEEPEGKPATRTRKRRAE